MQESLSDIHKKMCKCIQAIYTCIKQCKIVYRGLAQAQMAYITTKSMLLCIIWIFSNNLQHEFCEYSHVGDSIKHYQTSTDVCTYGGKPKTSAKQQKHYVYLVLRKFIRWAITSEMILVLHKWCSQVLAIGDVRLKLHLQSDLTKLALVVVHYLHQVCVTTYVT